MRVGKGGLYEVERLGRRITVERPLVLIGWEGRASASAWDNADLMVREWQGIQPVVRACCAFIFSAFDPHLDALARTAEHHGIPFFLQVRTWMPPHIPSWANNRRTWHAETASVRQVREWYARYPGMAGVQVVELNCFGLSGEERRYVADLIQASAEAGGQVSWQEANDGCNIWLEVGLDVELYRCIERHPAVLLPQWEMNVPKSMYLCHDSLMGLWLAGAVDNWGIEPQSWYWHEAGFTDLNRRPGEFDLGYRAGDIAKCPDGLWGQMVLLGASSGATVYSVEPFRGVVVDEQRTGYASPWRRCIEPLLAWLIAQRAIPSREQVAGKVRVAYYADFESAAFAERSDVDHYRGFGRDDLRGHAYTRRGQGTATLYEATYGLRHDWELIPNTGRYYWIPVMPKYTPTDVLLSFPAILAPNAFGGVAEARRYFDRHYPACGECEAWAVEVDGAGFACQTQENLDVPERFAATVSAAPASARGGAEPVPRMEMVGDLWAHQYLAWRPAGPDGRLALHVGNYASRETRLAFSPVRANDGAAASAGEKPLPRLEAAGLRVLSAVDALGGEADMAVEEMDGQLCVTIRHRGAVDLMIGCPSADGGETAPS